MSSNGIRSVKLGLPLYGVRAERAKTAGDSDRPTAEEKRLDQLRVSLARHEKELEKKQSELAEKEKKLESQLESLSGLLSSVRQKKAEILRDSEEEIVSFSLSIAEKVLQSEVENGRYKIGRIIESTLKNAKHPDVMAVRVHPDDCEMAAAALKKIGRPPGSADIQVVPDASVSPASCCIETGAGQIYSEIPDRLKRVKDALLTEGGMRTDEG